MAITYYFDFGSPYAYLGWQRIRAQPEHFGEVEFVPVSAAHIFRMDGSVPNSTLPNQGAYLMVDVARWAKQLGVPFAPPPAGTPGAMPVRSIEVMRLHGYAQHLGLDAAWREAVFLAYFQNGQNISDPEVIQGLAAQVGLIDAATQVADPRWKQLLIDNTAQAFERGAPGVPYTVIDDGIGYWGQDRLDMVADALAQQIPS